MRLDRGAERFLVSEGACSNGLRDRLYQTVLSLVSPTVLPCGSLASSSHSWSAHAAACKGAAGLRACAREPESTRAAATSAAKGRVPSQQPP